MSYLAQLQEMRRQPDAIGGAIIGLGQLAGGLGQAQQDAQDRQQKLEDRLREIATGKASALQKVGQSYVDQGNMQAAGKLLPDFAKSFNQAYGTDLPTAPIVGSPVMARGMDKVEQQGPPQVPGGKLLATVPTPYMYDTGKREFDESSQAAIRGGFLLPKVKPEPRDLMTASPFEDVIDKATMKVIRPAIGKPGDPNADLERMKLMAEIQKLSRPTGDPLEDAERQARIANLYDQIQNRNNPRPDTPKQRDPLDYEKQIQGLIFQQVPLTDIEQRTGVEDPELRRRRLQVGNDFRRQYPMQQPAAPAAPAIPASIQGGAGGTARWATEINAAATKYGIPPQVIQAVMAQESGGNASARSPVGAIGLMQLMPGTAAGLRVDPNDPAQNIEGGAKYLRQQFDKFGSWPKALAAYNAGPGAVERYGGIPPYRETQGYVDRITKRLAADGFNVGGAPAAKPKPKPKGPRKLSPAGQARADAFGLK